MHFSFLTHFPAVMSYTFVLQEPRPNPVQSKRLSLRSPGCNHLAIALKNAPSSPSWTQKQEGKDQNLLERARQKEEAAGRFPVSAVTMWPRDTKVRVVQLMCNRTIHPKSTAVLSFWRTRSLRSVLFHCVSSIKPCFHASTCSSA